MRESGILMHITSLPGAYGVGTMGKQAYSFVDFLKKADQRYWQILPLTPTGFGDSPYQSCSAFAGNPYLIDLESLVQQGLLEEQEITQLQWSQREDRVDFGLQYTNRVKVLHRAYGRFQNQDALDAYIREQAAWLPDYALYVAIKNQHNGAPWYQWEEALKFRRPEAMEQAKTQLADEIRFRCFVQYLFDSQWKALRDYAHEAGVSIIGDVPIYVPYDSVEVWKDPGYFLLDETLTPVAVAGCPPDYFSEDGQLWGNPLYRWNVHRADGYSWWRKRLESALERYDVVRVDHFRGFESYWAVPYGDKTAKGGRWLPGPGMELFRVLQEKLPGAKMIAEDLGFLTEQVHELRRATGYPGMKVLQFAFDSREPSDYLPYVYENNSVCYTGTHDNMTMRQWFETASEDAVSYAKEYMALTQQEGYVWGTIRTAMSSPADLCIIPIQDYLNLGAEARMNFPGTESGDNWTWRAPADFADPALAEKISRMTRLYGRKDRKKHNSSAENATAGNGDMEP